jgi:hypothetical protein
MNRRKFLKGLGFGAAGAALAVPSVLANKIRKAKLESTSGSLKEVDNIKMVVEMDEVKKSPKSNYHPNYHDLILTDERGNQSTHNYGQLKEMSYADLVQYFKLNP